MFLCRESRGWVDVGRGETLRIAARMHGEPGVRERQQTADVCGSVPEPMHRLFVNSKCTFVRRRRCQSPHPHPVSESRLLHSETH